MSNVVVDHGAIFFGTGTGLFPTSSAFQFPASARCDALRLQWADIQLGTVQIVRKVDGVTLVEYGTDSVGSPTNVITYPCPSVDIWLKPWGITDLSELKVISSTNGCLLWTALAGN